MFQFIIQHSPLLYFTQSLWRDEVYSLYMAAKPIPFFVSHLSFEPPFYYLLLHFWIQLFGMSEIAGRSLSFVAFGGATVIVIFWAEKLFKKHWLSWWLPVFFLFSIRCFFTTASNCERTAGICFLPRFPCTPTAKKNGSGGSSQRFSDFTPIVFFSSSRWPSFCIIFLCTGKKLS